jgi:hypothetical protein
MLFENQIYGVNAIAFFIYWTIYLFNQIFS